MQQLAWGSCAPFARSDDEKQAFADTALDCARMEVPLDYAAPDGRTAQIAVLRHRTHQTRTGSLVLNPGGPGGAHGSIRRQVTWQILQGDVRERLADLDAGSIQTCVTSPPYWRTTGRRRGKAGIASATIASGARSIKRFIPAWDTAQTSRLDSALV